jgi:hypothetical protein
VAGLNKRWGIKGDWTDEERDGTTKRKWLKTENISKFLKCVEVF